MYYSDLHTQTLYLSLWKNSGKNTFLSRAGVRSNIAFNRRIIANFSGELD